MEKRGTLPAPVLGLLQSKGLDTSSLLYAASGDMDDEGVYYYVRLDRETGKAIWRELGNGGNIAERSLIHMTIMDIRVEVRERMKQDEEEAKKAAERQRRKEMKTLTSVVPFQIGGKWGLKLDGRIIVPPIYRTIQAPVGKYCAMET